MSETSQGPEQTPRAESTLNQGSGRKLSPALWVVVGASALVVIGSLLPWASVGIFSTNGTSGDGVITLIAGLLAIGAVLLFTFATWNTGLVRAAAALLILVCLGTSLYDVINISGESAKIFGETISPSVGSGLWLCLVGSIVAAVALVIEFRSLKAPFSAGAQASA